MIYELKTYEIALKIYFYFILVFNWNKSRVQAIFFPKKYFILNTTVFLDFPGRHGWTEKIVLTGNFFH